MTNRLLGILLLGTALSLAACGGDSDSSGSSTSQGESTPPNGSTLSGLPIPDLPLISGLSGILGMPGLPSLPGIPGLPNLPPPLNNAVACVIKDNKISVDGVGCIVSDIGSNDGTAQLLACVEGIAKKAKVQTGLGGLVNTIKLENILVQCKP